MNRHTTAWSALYITHESPTPQVFAVVAPPGASFRCRLLQYGPYVGYESHEGIQSLQGSPLPGTRGEGAFRIRRSQGTEAGAKAEVGAGIRTRIHLRRILAIFSMPHTHAPFVVAHFGPSVHIQVAHAVS